MSKYDYNGGKTYEVYPNIRNEKVNFNNRYNINIFADIFYPEGFDKNKKYPAILVGHPHGGVKEQGSGMYAQEMASKGYVAIALDNSFNGESGGAVRRISSPEIFVDDFISAVDFLGTRKYVDRERIGAIGICASGGFVLNAASLDPRIKTLVTVVMYDMGRLTRESYDNSLTTKDRIEVLKVAGQKRWEDMESGTYSHAWSFPTTPLLEEQQKALPQFLKEYNDYYANTERGRHPQSVGGFTNNSVYSLMNFYPLNNIDLLEGRPKLIITGSIAHSKFFSDKAFELAPEPKRMHVVEGANHTDFYDKKEKIPFELIGEFLKETL